VKLPHGRGSAGTRRTLPLGLLLSIAVSGLGCAGTEPQTSVSTGASADASSVQRFRGLVVLGHEVRSFTPCGGIEPVWVSDPSGRLTETYRDLAPGLVPYEALFAVVRGRLGTAPEQGFGSDYEQQLVVTKVEYMAADGSGCNGSRPRSDRLDALPSFIRGPVTMG